MRLTCALALLMLSGCATYGSKFTLTKELPLSDTSAIQRNAAKRPFSKIIVLRPSGTDSSVFESLVASFEREFLRRGVTVISGAVTGRIVLSGDTASGDEKTETAARLTDIERALVMARGTGAEAVLQIGKYEVLNDVESRFLVYEDGKGVREVRRQEYVAWVGPKTSLASNASIFAGRLVDVSTGEIVAAFRVGCPSLWSLPADLTGEVFVAGGRWDIYNTSFPFARTKRWDAPTQRVIEERAEWERQGQIRCEQRIIDRLVELSLSEKLPAPDQNVPPWLEF